MIITVHAASQTPSLRACILSATTTQLLIPGISGNYIRFSSNESTDLLRVTVVTYYIRLITITLPELLITFLFFINAT